MLTSPDKEKGTLLELKGKGCRQMESYLPVSYTHLPYGHYKISESKNPTGYLTTGAVDCEFDIANDGEIMDLTDEAHSIYNQIILSLIHI